MERWIFRVAAAVLAIALAACGGRQSVASRSAAAYDEAIRKGAPVGGGHGHDGHGAAAPGGTAADEHAHHGASSAAPDHSDHAAAAAGDHAQYVDTDAHAGHAMPSGQADHAQHGTAARDEHAGHAMPSRSPGHAQHGTASQREHAQHDTASRDAHAGHAAPSQPRDHADHAAAPQQDHSQHGGASGGHQHGASTAAIPAGGLWGPVSGAAPASPRVAPALPMAPTPVTSDAMARVSPGSTLKPDAADTPASISVREAQKASGKEQP